MSRGHVVFSLLSVLLLSACAGVVQRGPDPLAGHGFRALVHVSGDFDGQVLMEAMPLTALIKGHGNATLTGRPYPPPFLTIDGDWSLIVEPQPGRESEAIAAIQRGDILIRRNGVAGALNPSGTVRAWKAALQPMSAPAPPPPPPPEPTKPPGEPVAAALLESPKVCGPNDKNCQLPNGH
jgi:hypothetical protein